MDNDNTQSLFDKFTCFCVKFLNVILGIFNYYLILQFCSGIFTRILGILFIVILHISVCYQVINKLTKNKYAELIKEFYNKTLIGSDTTEIKKEIDKLYNDYGYVKLLCYFCVALLLKTFEIFYCNI